MNAWRRSMRRLAPDGSQYNPTVMGRSDFDAEALAISLNNAMKGTGTDEDSIVQILGSCNFEQRAQIAEMYKANFGVDAKDDLSGELTGVFETLVKTCLRDPAKCAAYALYKAMKGAGTDEDVIIQILCSMTNSEIEEVKAAYLEVLEEHGEAPEGNGLEDRISSELDGYVKRICVALLQGQRKEPSEEDMDKAMKGDMGALIDKDAATEQAQKLYDAGEGKWGTDEDTFISLIVRESCWQLAQISVAYQQISNMSLLEAVKSEFSGCAEKALVTVVESALDRPKFLATKVHDCIAGLGTCDSGLIYLIVSRSEVDLATVINSYKELFEEDMLEAVRNDTDGEYRDLLLKLCGEN